MNIGQGRVDRSIQAALTGLAARQRVIGDNVANVDTPGFKASEVEFESALRRLMARPDGPDGFKLARPQGSIAFREPEATIPAPRVVALDQTSLREDQNNVDIDQEMVQLAETNTTYSALTQLMNTRMQLLRTAINDGRR